MENVTNIFLTSYLQYCAAVLVKFRSTWILVRSDDEENGADFWPHAATKSDLQGF